MQNAGSTAIFLYLLKTARDLTYAADTLSSEDAAGTFPSYQQQCQCHPAEKGRKKRDSLRDLPWKEPAG